MNGMTVSSCELPTVHCPLPLPTIHYSLLTNAVTCSSPVIPFPACERMLEEFAAAGMGGVAAFEFDKPFRDGLVESDALQEFDVQTVFILRLLRLPRIVGRAVEQVEITDLSEGAAQHAHCPDRQHYWLTQRPGESDVPPAAHASTAVPSAQSVPMSGPCTASIFRGKAVAAYPPAQAASGPAEQQHRLRAETFRIGKMHLQPGEFRADKDSEEYANDQGEGRGKRTRRQ